jgi:hypothetical protein
MTSKLKAAGVAAVLLLVGCTLIPKYQRPALPVPEQYPGPAVTAPSVAAADIAAHEVFRDARLNALVDLALANNRDLRTAVLNVLQTQAQYRISRAALVTEQVELVGGQPDTGAETVFGEAGVGGAAEPTQAAEAAEAAEAAWQQRAGAEGTF